MRRTRGRSFKITKNQAKGYGYASAKGRSMKANPGVTTIAAINGRGAYGARKSARSVMSKLKKNARVGVARKRLSAAQKSAFKRRMAAGRMAANRSTSRSQSATSRKNIKKAQSARRAWGQKLPKGKRVRVGKASYGTKAKATRLKAGVYIANRRKMHPEDAARLKQRREFDRKYAAPKRKSLARERRKRTGSYTMARRRKRAVGLKKKRRSSKRRRSTAKKTTTVKRRRRRKSRKGAARRKTSAKKTVRRRRRRVAKKTTVKRRRRRAKASVAAPKRRRRKASKKGTSRKRRRTGKARRKSSRRRKGSARRRSRKGVKAKSAPRKRRRKASSKRRRSRRGYNRKPQTTRLLTANKRRRSRHRKNKSHKANRRRHRRNGRKGFRMNGVGDVLKLGATVFAGFALHRVLANTINDKIIPMLTPAPAATSGLDSTSLKGLALNLGTAGLTAFVASKVIKNTTTRQAVIGGIVASAVQSLVSSVLMKYAPPSFAGALAGPDGTAARLSAMYGLGAGASIMPRYAAINGLGEYFREPMNGLGEYFREPMNGVGEYISATNGLGAYENNGDLYQAAAGFGSHDYNGNHIDPSGDLERQLDIAEAAAGVGAVSPFEAAAGIGPMQAAAGFGAIDRVASADTWIPGSADPQLWAGVKAISNGQSATEMVPAGTLQSEGGQGIFG